MSALIRDRYGVDVEASDAAAVAALDEAVHCLAGLEGDLVAAAARPVLVLGRCLAAYLDCYTGSRSGYAAARAVLDGTPAPSAPRERAHLAAARSWADGDLDAAARHLERALLRNPRDLLALKVAQDLYFMLGDRVNLRDVAARVLPAWRDDSPGAGYVLGMYAFGLEECGDYAAAERFGRAALAASRRDAWAAHAVIHVYEMTGRPEEGLAFAADSAAGWGPSFFAVHNWWHTGLYQLELGRLREALAVYDNRVITLGLATPLGQVDAASLLWRLWLHGADLGEAGPGEADTNGGSTGGGGSGRAGTDGGRRAALLADAFEHRLLDSAYCFNDWHAAMALALAGRLETAELLAAELPARARGTNKVMLDRAGLDVIRGVIAFARRQYPLAVELLGRARPYASVIGGSHAQRDAIDLTLLAAAAAADATAGTAISVAAHEPYDALVRALVNERTARKPAAGLAARLVIDASRERALRLGAARHGAAYHGAAHHGTAHHETARSLTTATDVRP
ncbi:MAG TPA: tetratricopeptide repeat protein [Trebonia sp.]|nr:tetratricopeptide repeat protein [Trebonia sp.]